MAVLNKHAVLIVNTKSRRGRDWYERSRQCLTDRGVILDGCHAVRDPRQVKSLTQEAVANAVPLIIVGGGDGTLSNVARYFVDSNSVLGVLPLGTGNAFARDLGIEPDVEKACDVLASGIVSEVDLGIAGEDYFLNVATVGLSTLIAGELTNDAKHAWGRLVYIVALFHALARLKPFRATIATEDGEHTFETLQIVIGNGRYHAGPFLLAPNASITDGKLIVYSVVGHTRLELLRFALNLPGGQHVKLREVPTIWTTAGTLKTAPQQKVTVDGEICDRTPLRFGIKPCALRVMTPAEFASSE